MKPEFHHTNPDYKDSNPDHCCNFAGSAKIPSIKDLIKNKIEQLEKHHDCIYNKAQDLKTILDMLPTTITDYQEHSLRNILSSTLNCID